MVGHFHLATFAVCTNDKHAAAISEWAIESVKHLHPKHRPGFFAPSQRAKTHVWLPVTTAKYEAEFKKLYDTAVQRNSKL